MTPDRALTAAAERFSADRLRLARQCAGLRKNELARKLDLTPAAITQYEQGQMRPRPRVVAALALALDRPPEYFIADGRPLQAADASTAFFRSLRATRQYQREQAAAQAVVVWEIATAIQRHVLLPIADLPDLALPERASQRMVEEAAGALRDAWGLGVTPLANVVRTLEQHGVIVARLASVVPTIDAFSQWIGGRPIVVLWAGKNDAARSRFDAAHELAHLALHHDPDPGNRIIEDQAQAFASALLMPAATITDLLPRRAPRGDGWLELFNLKARFGVSLQALLYRAKTLGVLCENDHRRAMIQLSERGWRTNEPADLGPCEEPVLLRQAIELLEANQRSSAVQIARDIRVPRSVIDAAVAAPQVAA